MPEEKKSHQKKSEVLITGAVKVCEIKFLQEYFIGQGPP
jgi:hypothetical protein